MNSPSLNLLACRVHDKTENDFSIYMPYKRYKIQAQKKVVELCRYF